MVQFIVNLKGYFLKFTNIIINWVKRGYFYVSLVMVLSLLTFVKIAVNVVTKDEIVRYDRVIVDFINRTACPSITNFVLFLTDFGYGFIIIFFMVAVIAFATAKIIQKILFLLVLLP